MQFCHAYDLHIAYLMPFNCATAGKKFRLSKISLLGLTGSTSGIRPQETDSAKFLVLNFSFARCLCNRYA